MIGLAIAGLLAGLVLAGLKAQDIWLLVMKCGPPGVVRNLTPSLISAIRSALFVVILAAILIVVCNLLSRPISDSIRWNISEDGLGSLMGISAILGLAVGIPTIILTAVNYLFTKSFFALRGPICVIVVITVIAVVFEMFLLDNVVNISRQSKDSVRFKGPYEGNKLYGVFKPFYKAKYHVRNLPFVFRGKLYANGQFLERISEINQFQLYLHEKVHLILRIDGFQEGWINKVVESLAYLIIPFFWVALYIVPFTAISLVRGNVGWLTLLFSLSASGVLLALLNHLVKKYSVTEVSTKKLEKEIQSIKKLIIVKKYENAKSKIENSFVLFSGYMCIAITKTSGISSEIKKQIESDFSYVSCFTDSEHFEHYAEKVYKTIAALCINQDIEQNRRIISRARYVSETTILYILNKLVKLLEDNSVSDEKIIEDIYDQTVKPFRSSTKDVSILGYWGSTRWDIREMMERISNLVALPKKTLNRNWAARLIKLLITIAIAIAIMPLVIVCTTVSTIKTIRVLRQWRGNMVLIKGVFYEIVSDYLIKAGLVEESILKHIAKVNLEADEIKGKTDSSEFVALLICIVISRFGYKLPVFIDACQLQDVELTVAIYEQVSEDVLALLEEGSRQKKGNVVLVPAENWLIFKMIHGKKLPCITQGLVFHEGRLSFIRFTKPQVVHYVAAYTANTLKKLKKLGVPTPGNLLIEDYTEEKDITADILDKAKIRTPKTISVIVNNNKHLALQRRRQQNAQKVHFLKIKNTDITKEKLSNILFDFLTNEKIKEGVIKPNQGRCGDDILFFNFENLGQRALEAADMLKKGINLVIQERLTPPLNLGKFKLSEKEAAQLKHDIEIISIKAYKAIKEAMIVDKVLKDESENGTDFMGTDIILVLEEGKLVPYVLEVNDYHSGSMWDIDDYLKKLSRGEKPLLQQMVDEGKTELDWNLRVFISRDEIDRATMSEIVVRVDELGGAINISKGAGAITYEEAMGIPLQIGKDRIGKSSRDWINTMVRRGEEFKSTLYQERADNSDGNANIARCGVSFVTLSSIGEMGLEEIWLAVMEHGPPLVVKAFKFVLSLISRLKSSSFILPLLSVIILIVIFGSCNVASCEEEDKEEYLRGIKGITRIFDNLCEQGGWLLVIDVRWARDRNNVSGKKPINKMLKDIGNAMVGILNKAEINKFQERVCRTKPQGGDEFIISLPFNCNEQDKVKNIYFKIQKAMEQIQGEMNKQENWECVPPYIAVGGEYINKDSINGEVNDRLRICWDRQHTAKKSEGLDSLLTMCILGGNGKKEAQNKLFAKKLEQDLDERIKNYYEAFKNKFKERYADSEDVFTSTALKSFFGRSSFVEEYGVVSRDWLSLAMSMIYNREGDDFCLARQGPDIIYIIMKKGGKSYLVRIDPQYNYFGKNKKKQKVFKDVITNRGGNPEKDEWVGFKLVNDISSEQKANYMIKLVIAELLKQGLLTKSFSEKQYKAAQKEINRRIRRYKLKVNLRTISVCMDKFNNEDKLTRPIAMITLLESISKIKDRKPAVIVFKKNIPGLNKQKEQIECEEKEQSKISLGEKNKAILPMDEVLKRNNISLAQVTLAFYSKYAVVLFVLGLGVVWALVKRNSYHKRYSMYSIKRIKSHGSLKKDVTPIDDIVKVFRDSFTGKCLENMLEVFSKSRDHKSIVDFTESFARNLGGQKKFLRKKEVIAIVKRLIKKMLPKPLQDVITIDNNNVCIPIVYMEGVVLFQLEKERFFSKEIEVVEMTVDGHTTMGVKKGSVVLVLDYAGYSFLIDLRHYLRAEDVKIEYYIARYDNDPFLCPHREIVIYSGNTYYRNDFKTLGYGWKELNRYA
ncbi:MAG: hypothetical protein ABIB11_04345, partial [Candidatus Omnitrophota bacterium]